MVIVFAAYWNGTISVNEARWIWRNKPCLRTGKVREYNMLIHVVTYWHRDMPEQAGISEDNQWFLDRSIRINNTSGLLLQENRSATCEAEEPSILLRLEKAVFAEPPTASTFCPNGYTVGFCPSVEITNEGEVRSFGDAFLSLEIWWPAKCWSLRTLLALSERSLSTEWCYKI